MAQCATSQIKLTVAGHGFLPTRAGRLTSTHSHVGVVCRSRAQPDQFLVAHLPVYRSVRLERDTAPVSDLPKDERGSTDDTPPYSYSPLLEWDLVQKRLPWGVLLLMGGGFALADSSQKSGLSAWIGNSMEGFKVLPPWIICLLLSLIVTAATEITSNSATTTILLPIVAELGENLHINPLYFMMSCTIAASFAFMLPVATPPNAIVFSTGYLRINDMMKAGIVMNIITAIILLIAINTWGNAYFRLYQFPFDSVNVTTSRP